MTEALRQQVRERAGHRCEYCRLREAHSPQARFHIEHVTAKQHRGKDEPSNLCLACNRCNLHKGPNLAGIDPDGDGVALVPLFNPRRDRWMEHFRYEGAAIVGLSAVGRATVWVLNMNAEAQVMLRQALLERGELD
jgi:hypothetical protein